MATVAAGATKEARPHFNLNLNCEPHAQAASCILGNGAVQDCSFSTAAAVTMQSLALQPEHSPHSTCKELHDGSPHCWVVPASHACILNSRDRLVLHLKRHSCCGSKQAAVAQLTHSSSSSSSPDTVTLLLLLCCYE